MKYHLLTGATGLLGYYLLHDAARIGVPLAVVVRPTRMASARQRIEDLLARWERTINVTLPRPVVLEGDLTKPLLGFDEETVDWVGEYCEALIHNAASLTFRAESPEGEPYRSNVTGTANVLGLCQRAGIRRFHHVSTAYVCGLREGTILESELDVGQTLGNDYEKSKVQSEKMVAEADFLDSVTVLRPGIIIGDSRTGYTSTFHGFFVPLKVGHGLISSVASGSGMDVPTLISLFDLDGQERKNFVPVDWVSAVMMQVIATPDLHGRTYHLTPENRTPLSEMAEVMAEVIVASPPAKTMGNVSIDLYHNTLVEQLQVYQAYWRDDPVFDLTNTHQAAANLPCPTVDRAMLRRMCQYAIQANFGWPIEPSSIPEFDVHAALAEACPSSVGRQDGELLGLQVNGPGGGQWALEVCDGQVVGHQLGLSDRCRATAYLNCHTYRAIRDGRLSAVDALRQGVLLLETASDSWDDRWVDALQTLVGKKTNGVVQSVGRDDLVSSPSGRVGT
jgi:thioester reductase-like protein